LRDEPDGTVEAAAVIDGSRSPITSRRFDDWLTAAQTVVEPVTIGPA
jgi:hypothetical protein